MRDSNINYRLIYYNADALNLIDLVFNNSIKYIKNKRIKIVELVLLEFEVLNIINHIFLISRDDINSFNMLT